MKVHPARRARPAVEVPSMLYLSGEAVPEGTYVSLEDGRFVRIRAGGALPPDAPLPHCYMRVSPSADYTAPVSLIVGRA
jgi:hypothetical protein